MMETYNFELIFKLKNQSDNGDKYLDRLYEEGCDDATVSTGKMGIIALNFSREEKSASRAVLSAIKDVRNAIPNAVLVEAGPDMVNITDISRILKHSRQNTRKLFEKSMPTPIHMGSPAIWHLHDVVMWATKKMGRFNIDAAVRDLSHVSKLVNEKRMKYSLQSDKSNTKRYKVD